eukprot:1157588-Pelagomonas_calceolata.AAC.9
MEHLTCSVREDTAHALLDLLWRGLMRLWVMQCVVSTKHVTVNAMKRGQSLPHFTNTLHAVLPTCSSPVAGIWMSRERAQNLLPPLSATTSSQAHRCGGAWWQAPWKSLQSGCQDPSCT